MRHKGPKQPPPYRALNQHPRDFIAECIETSQPKMAVSDFGKTWCARCGNPQCLRSPVQGGLWHSRMFRQIQLLENPLFAPPDDPLFKELRERDFLTIIEAPTVHLIEPETTVRPLSEFEETQTVEELVAAEPEVEPVEPAAPVKPITVEEQPVRTSNSPTHYRQSSAHNTADPGKIVLGNKPEKKATEIKIQPGGTVRLTD